YRHISRRVERATLGAHCRACRDQAPMRECWNIGRTRRDFQCRVRIINGLFAAIAFHTKWIPVRVKKTRQSSILAAAVSRLDRGQSEKDNASVPEFRKRRRG